METTATLEPTAEETAELEAAIRSMLDQMEQADARIRRHQQEIERLRSETRAMLAQLKTTIGG